MSADSLIQNNDEIKLAKYVRDSLRISENLSKNLRACIDKNKILKDGDYIKKEKISFSREWSKNSTKKKSETPVKISYSIKSKSKTSKTVKKIKPKMLTTNEQSIRRAKIRRELPTAIHGDLRIGTAYVNGRQSINMRCNPKNVIKNNNISSESSFGKSTKSKKKEIISNSSSSSSNKEKRKFLIKNVSSNAKKAPKNKETNNINYEIKDRQMLKNTPHVFDPLNSEDTYPNIVRSPVTPNSVTSEIPYCDKNKKRQNKEILTNEGKYYEVQGTHVGFLIKTFKKNTKIGYNESIYDMVFDLSINIGKNKREIPLNIIANFASDRNPVIATNGILFEQE